MKYVAKLIESEHQVNTTIDDTVVVDNKKFHCEQLSGGQLLLTDIAGNCYRAFVKSDDDELIVSIENYFIPVQLTRTAIISAKNILKIQEGSADASHATIIAPMPGLVRKILVAVGDEIKKGSVLIILEAMKMENEVRSLHDGVVESIAIVAGNNVEKSRSLMTIKRK